MWAESSTEAPKMTTAQVRTLIESQIGDDWATTNYHGVDLRHALVSPRTITVVERSVGNGKVHDGLVVVWLILVENTAAGNGYRIVLKDDESLFGLAVEGLPSDQHLVLCGWYGDFLTTFRAM